jgi:site-specific DNA recombinase
MHVAIYARVSTVRQAQAQTTDQQLDRLRAHAEKQGWGWAADRVFRDDGYSGASLRRPGLDRLRDAAAGARLDRILITEPDRLARNYVHQVLLVEELQKHGAEVEFLDRPMSRDPHDQLLLQIRGAVAEYERTLIAERMRRGRLRKLRAGTLLPWTRPPYGYRLDPDRPRDPAGVRLDEAEAAVVRDLFAWFADEGATIYGLRQRLDQLGIVSPRGYRTWNGSALHGVLTNPTYLGQIFANRVRARPAERRRSALLPVGRSGTGATQAVDPAEWIAVAPVPAIVSQAQFDRAQERLAYNRRMARRNNRVHPYLLRGLVSCGRCRLGCSGLHMPTGYDYYVCRTKTRSQLLLSGERCPARYIPARALEELVWRDLCEVLATPEMIAHAMERAELPKVPPAKQVEWQRRGAAGTGCRRNCRRVRPTCAVAGLRLANRSSGSQTPTSQASCRWPNTSAGGVMPMPGCRRWTDRSMSLRMMPNVRAKQLALQLTPRLFASVCARAWPAPALTKNERCWNCWSTA